MKNLTGKKFKAQFELVLKSLEEAGYNNYWQVLNAKDYGIPQNRERVFIVSVRKDIDTGRFEFPKGIPLEVHLKDITEEGVSDDYYLTEKQIESIANWKAQQKPFKRVLGKNSICATLTARGAGEYHSGMILYCDKLNETTDIHEECLHIKEATLKGYSEAYPGDSVNYAYPKSTTRRGRVGHQVAQTLTTSPQQAIVTEFLELRTLTEKECFRLTGFSDDDFEKAKSVSSKRYLYKQAGNSIVVAVPYHIIEALFKANIFIEQENNEMEFKINEVQIPEKPTFNYEELKQELQEKATMYASLVYGDDEIKQAKSDKANLNKLKKALNDERIRQEKEYMKPFNEFKAQVNEIIGIIDKPINVIDEQVKLFEEKQKDEKLEKIKEFWEGTEHPDWLHCKQIFDSKWLNTATSMKKVQEAIEERLAQIDADVKTIGSLPEFSFEALETYKMALDLNRAIAEGQRLADIQRRKQEAEAARLKAEAEKTVVETKTPPAPEPVKAEAAPSKQWVNFAAFLSTDDAAALKAFCDSRNIEIKAI